MILAFAIFQMSVLVGKRVDQAASIMQAEQTLEPLMYERAYMSGVDVSFLRKYGKSTKLRASAFVRNFWIKKCYCIKIL